MRADRASRDSRHNKDHDNLKSSLKKPTHKRHKHRVVFNEGANEYFEADYIIVVRDECGYSDEGENEECSGCGSCERHQEPEAGALSPPDGYKDMGLFNRDGTLREQAWWEAGDVLLVGERSGTVFTPQHLQLLRRLQRERMLRSAICADCDAHAALHQPLEMEYSYEEEEGSDGERELRPVARRTGKHIAAGEERPRSNSSQQTTPTEECSPEICNEDGDADLPSAPFTSEESDTADMDGRGSSDSSPLRQRRGGILKGGRLWKSSLDIDSNEQTDTSDQRSATASDEDAATPRSVRFVERPRDPAEHHPKEAEPQPPPPATNHVAPEMQAPKETPAPVTVSSSQPVTSVAQSRLEPQQESPQTVNHQPPKGSAVQQLFNSGRPPPPAIEPQLVTSETLRAWDAGVRPKSEEAAVRRVAERNALRCSLLRSEARKKTQPKPETSLAERIRLLTCDVDDEPDEQQQQRTSPAGASIDKSSQEKAYPGDKGYAVVVDKANEKAFGSGSSSSSSSTLSVPVLTRQQPPDLADVHHDHPKPKQEPRRQFLASTLAPLTACVGSTASHEGFYYGAGDRGSASLATHLDVGHTDAPAPDVVAGTPGAGDGDDGLAAFARASAPRTERLRQRYQEQPSSDDEHDDYGFHRRPAVRGISVKPQLAAADDMLHQMQQELAPGGPPMPHACQRSAQRPCDTGCRPQSRASSSASTWSKSSDYVSGRQCVVTPVPVSECYSHAPHGQHAGHAAHVQSVANAANMAAYAHYARQDYRNCALYANVGSCSDSSAELYSGSEPSSPARRRPESPPPIRAAHRLLYVPFSLRNYAQYSHYGSVQYCPQQTCVTSSPAAQQAPQHSAAMQMQNMCPVPARYRPVPAPQPGGGKQMICYSEKVQAPMYQPAAPGSPQRSRGAPEGAPATSAAPMYYAMNV